MIREYILHDRGNSIFLGDSFANLPSPVGEGQTIKNLFRFAEDDDEGKKLEREKEREKNEIKIEGKPEKYKKETKAPEKSHDLNMIDIAEIDKIVFEATKNG
jgi:Ran GTPase-activating protein (RanGAP) involved in mRNA processing and transport